jgi:drug/metabolite transporter (DMT)-like permease
MDPLVVSPSVIAAFFVLLAAIFLILSATRGSPPARKTWRRIGIIFAMVALVIFAVRPR